MNKLFELFSLILITANCLSLEQEVKHLRHFYLMSSSQEQAHEATTYVDYLHDEKVAK